MHYLIDGYNFLFRLWKKKSSFESQRKALIAFLAERVPDKATVVFDSDSPREEDEHSHFKSLEVVYTFSGLSADQYILKYVEEASSPQKIVVVTSDKQLTRLAKHLQAQTQTIEIFFSHLKKPKGYPKKKILKTKQGLSALPEQPPSSEVLDDRNLFDYYLQTFEKAFENLPLFSKKRASLKGKKQGPFETEEQRWLRIFEQTFHSKEN